MGISVQHINLTTTPVEIFNKCGTIYIEYVSGTSQQVGGANLDIGDASTNCYSCIGGKFVKFDAPAELWGAVASSTGVIKLVHWY